MISFSKTSWFLKENVPVVFEPHLGRRIFVTAGSCAHIVYLVGMYHTTRTPPCPQDFQPALALPSRSASTPVSCRAPLFNVLKKLFCLCSVLFFTKSLPYSSETLHYCSSSSGRHWGGGSNLLTRSLVLK